MTWEIHILFSEILKMLPLSFNNLVSWAGDLCSRDVNHNCYPFC